VATYEKKPVNLGYMPLKYLRLTPKTSKVIQNQMSNVFFFGHGRALAVAGTLVDIMELANVWKLMTFVLISWEAIVMNNGVSTRKIFIETKVIQTLNRTGYSSPTNWKYLFMGPF